MSDIWRGEPWPKHIVLLDNDFFGQADWSEKLDEAVRMDLKICFNQGINIRLVNEEQARKLKDVFYCDDQFKTRRLYTAWDNLGDERIFKAGVKTLTDAGIPAKHLMVYMLIGFREGRDGRGNLSTVSMRCSHLAAIPIRWFSTAHKCAVLAGFSTLGRSGATISLFRGSPTHRQSRKDSTTGNIRCGPRESNRNGPKSIIPTLVSHKGGVDHPTPAKFYAELDAEFHFDYDPCPLNGNVGPLFGPDGLHDSWEGRRVYCNPPYGKGIPKFLAKAHEAYLAVFLVPVRTDTKWFHDIVLPHAEGDTLRAWTFVQ